MNSTISRLPAPAIESYEWQFDGACRGADEAIFFSPEDERGSKRLAREAKAKEFCTVCPVVAACLEHALRVREPFGVWGGLNTRERNDLIASGSSRVRHAS
ncbi:WhiB family transcriptional regulator [Mumia zhuanghuii]|uniref:Transcriptional regulator WhiB n=2 Tax=Mumia TaxID=1546255 RepID=A0ABW1QI93_9ACTN|nr:MULTISPECIES: WhiB family transcriptional regulator [Mumia]KAA1418397.1 WhiB family transcriptional regulator [Mumia zhuanghuii]